MDKSFQSALLLILLYNISWISFHPYAFVRAEGNKDTPLTGSWQNCTETYVSVEDARRELLPSSPSSQNYHPDSDIITISCTNIHYRVPQSSIQRIQQMTKDPIIIGVLSGAGGKGPSKRNSIRSTWAYRKRNVFFIVAGPWNKIKYEYDRYGDLLWIDKDEIYVTETSVLTFKTESFVAVMYNKFMKAQNNMEVGEFSYLFKADDDSYVNLVKLYRALLEEPHDGNFELNYWGKCNEGGWKPHRDKSNKWYISEEIYPEPEYPPFCQGAGIAMSKKFLDCAIGKNHIAQIRYQPNEDVAIGLLAERCNIEPMHDDRVLIRYDEEEEEGITMHKKIIQHYVKTDYAMREHHKDVTGVRGVRMMGVE